MKLSYMCVCTMKSFDILNVKNTIGEVPVLHHTLYTPSVVLFRHIWVKECVRVNSYIIYIEI